jgi:four helix bundle protein
MDKYRSLLAWQRAHQLALTVLRATDIAHHPRHRQVFEQLRRAAVSVEANVVEGYALGTTPQFKRHLRIALGSAAEAECLIRLAGEVEYLPGSVANEIEVVTGATMRCLLGLLRKPIPARKA